MVSLTSIAGKLFSNNKKVLVEDYSSPAWDGTVLSGQALTDVGIVGANPEARLYPDGSIVGSSDNGSFTKYANGNLECAGSAFSEVSKSFPVVFIAIPDILTGSSSTNPVNAYSTYWYIRNTFSLTLQVVVTSLTNQNVWAPSARPGSYIAKGRWKA